MRKERHAAEKVLGMIHPGFMFRDAIADYETFFDYGIGAMCWSFDAEARRELYFLAPCPDAPRGFEVARILTMTDGKGWTHPGAVSGWDGNLERPTFTPSIWLRNRSGWHGFIRNGNLEDAG